MRIDGYFNAHNEPVIRTQLDSIDVEILVDTGFDGGLIIPSQIVGQLKLEFEGIEVLYSVTGEKIFANAYSIEIGWLGKRRRVPIAVSSKFNEAILGNQMLQNCRLQLIMAIAL